MKAIILAAGMGTRLDKYTKDLPKGMLNFKGKSLIQRQVDVLREAGINDIIIITGYMKDKIQIENVEYYNNDDFENTNMVASLFCAEEELNEEVLVCYGDIIYEKKVIEAVLNSEVDVGVTIDEDYLDYWKARLEDWEDDIESLVMENGKIVELGAPCSLDKAQVRYVGLIKFSKKGVEVMKRLWNENKAKYWNKDEKFLSSKSFKKLYMTDMLQLIINSGQEVNPISIKRGWLEFDTNEDYEKVNSWLESGKLKEFIEIN